MGEFIDKLQYVEGVFYLEAKDKKGNIVWTLNDNNLVVISGRQAMAMLLAELADTKQITSIGFSNEVASEDETLSDLTNAHVKALDSYSYPEETSVKFEWSLGFSEYNTNEITNYGLFTNDGTLFAMKVRPKITKDEYISLNGSWTILL